MIAGLTLCVVCDVRVLPAPAGSTAIGGPYALLLASSTDLGSARSGDAQLTVVLRASTHPSSLMAWAAGNQLSVRWAPGDAWAIVAGAPAGIASAFGVPVHDYRGRRGQVFYASPQQPVVPDPVRGDVSAVGRILGYSPHHMARPDFAPADLPAPGLTPSQLLRAYNASSLAQQGYTGRGMTIVFFEFDGFAQEDLDTYADKAGLPRFAPIVVGGQPDAPHGETTMDLEVAHAIAPDAQLVVVNALPTVQGDGAYEKIARMLSDADRRFPGAIWSLSIGWGCDKLLTAADLAPVAAALATAQSHGTSAFDASGDNGGLECKGGEDWSAPPGPSDIGLDAVASLPAMTVVGGTTLSVGEQGDWLAEQAWFDSPLSIGSSGGVSNLFSRPPWQRRVSSNRDTEHRLSPDISAAADPFTGVRIVFNLQVLVGGGTSQSAPIWAALSAVMTQYLLANGGQRLGALNPLLYRIAAGTAEPAFRDVALGGNAVDLATPGFDLVTGLGPPNVDNLVKDLRDIQTGVR